MSEVVRSEYVEAVTLICGAFSVAAILGAVIGWLSPPRNIALLWLLLALPVGVVVFYGSIPYMISTASIPKGVTPASDGTAAGIVTSGIIALVAAGFVLIVKTFLAACAGAVLYMLSFFVARHFRHRATEESAL